MSTDLWEIERSLVFNQAISGVPSSLDRFLQPSVGMLGESMEGRPAAMPRPREPAPRRGALEAGRQLLSVQGRSVSGLDFDEMMRIVREERPLVLRFRTKA